MSRIGKQPVTIPEKTEVAVDGNTVTVRGQHGELKRSFPPEVTVVVEDGQVVVSPKKKTQAARALWGTWASLIQNMITGVDEKYERTLVLEGVGYRAEVQGNMLVMQLGFSHEVKLEIPEGIDVSAEKETITISGIDKELVGHFAATIRATKKPEPYKGKGIRYKGEVIRRKQGKKAVTAGE